MGAQFQEACADADTSFSLIVNLEPDHLMEIESIAFEGREFRQREIEISLDEVFGIVGVNILEKNDELVATSVLDFIDLIRDQFSIQVDEYGGQVLIAFRVVGIKKGTQATL